MATQKRTVKSVLMINSKNEEVTVHLKWSNDPKAAADGRSWYLVIGGAPHFPAKAEGLPTEFGIKIPEVVSNWANNKLKFEGYRLIKG